jgi:hypothetical protein
MPNVEARDKETVKVSCRYLKPEAWLVILITAYRYRRFVLLD